MDIKFDITKTSRYETYLSQTAYEKLGEELMEKIRQAETISRKEITNILFQKHTEEQNQALVKARALGLQPVIDRFSRVLELPTATYLREFLQSQSISMCKGNDVTSEKKQALYASNIKHWNNK
ncbi:MAG: hypothetical protein EZS28_056054, partial [Streblomastix strix]